MSVLRVLYQVREASAMFAGIILGYALHAHYQMWQMVGPNYRFESLGLEGISFAVLLPPFHPKDLAELYPTLPTGYDEIGFGFVPTGWVHAPCYIAPLLLSAFLYGILSGRLLTTYRRIRSRWQHLPAYRSHGIGSLPLYVLRMFFDAPAMGCFESTASELRPVVIAKMTRQSRTRAAWTRAEFYTVLARCVASRARHLLLAHAGRLLRLFF
jgi:hypothetical protein